MQEKVCQNCHRALEGKEKRGQTKHDSKPISDRKPGVYAATRKQLGRWVGSLPESGMDSAGLWLNHGCIIGRTGFWDFIWG